VTNRGIDDEWIDRLEHDLDIAQTIKRPRSKRRPQHADAVAARVVGVDRGRYSLSLMDPPHTAIRANRARELRNEAIVVGDVVDIVGDTSGDEGTLSRIVRIHERRNVLRRSADDTDQYERVIVANADLLLMVVAAANPEPRPRLIDRYVVAALDAGIDPVLCVTKTDLSSPDALRDYASGLDIPVIALRNDGGADDFETLRSLLAGKVSVAVGHSGVGKSTLVNRLVPEAQRDVGVVNEATGRGRHTSSSSVSLELPSGGWIIDTPGVRSFGLGHVSPEAIDRGFPDLEHYLSDCPRGCEHLSHLGECGLNLAVSSGAASERERARIDSLQRLRQLAGSSEPPSSSYGDS
jgi:ribosome biogenesis GTPase